MKVEIDAKYLRTLAEKSIESGKEKIFISIALDWADQAEAEIVRLNKLIERERQLSKKEG